jgi:osmoprotectant transport system permease protein
VGSSAGGNVISLQGADEPTNVVEWFTHLEDRAGSGPISEQMWLTVWHSGVALAIVLVLAIPAAAVLAHHRKGELLASWVVSIGRAVPTITVVGLLVIVSLRNGFGIEPWPIIGALVLLGLPPAFINTYAAVRGVEPSAVDAAQAMGFTHRQVLQRVELPLALPVIMAGVRTAAVQIVATEPLAAFFGGEGLGAYLRAGLSRRDFVTVQGGALLVALVAIATELALIAVTRLVIPRGIRLTTTGGRAARRLRREAAPATT